MVISIYDNFILFSYYYYEVTVKEIFMEDCLLLLQHIPVTNDLGLRQQAIHALDTLLLQQPHTLIPKLATRLVTFCTSLHPLDRQWIAQFPESIITLQCNFFVNVSGFLSVLPGIGGINSGSKSICSEISY